jgi:hypothetical protein
MTGPSTPIRQAEVDAFVVKLERWARSLPPKERALLEALVRTASTNMPDGDLSEAQLAAVKGGATSQFETRASSVLSTLVRKGDSMSFPVES